MEAKIKPQDLKLHNLLLNPKGEVFVVKSIDFDEIHSDPNEYIINHYKLDECFPIELSEAWLERMGWTKEDEGKYAKGYTDLSYCLHLGKSFKDGRYFLGIRYDDWTHDSVTVHYFTYCVKYIHQLQNAWQILTGSELTIKDINNIEVK